MNQFNKLDDFYNSLGFISVLDPKYVKFTKPIHDKVEGHNDYFKTPSEWLNNWLWEGDIMKYLGFHNKNNTDSVFKKFVKPIDNETGLVSGKYFSISEVLKSWL